MKKFISGFLTTAMIFASTGTAFAVNEIPQQDSVTLFSEENEAVNLLKDGGFERGLLNTENQWKFIGGANPWYSCGTASIDTECMRAVIRFIFTEELSGKG